MAMFNIFFDASGAPDDSKAVAMAGFIGTAEQWKAFERNWAKAMADYGVSALHMRDYAHSLREFASWKGDEQRRRRFLERLVNVIQVRTLHSFACAVIMDAFREVDTQYELSEHYKPIALAAASCVDKVKRWAKEKKIDSTTIAYLFEDGDKDKASLTRAMERHFGFTPIYLHKSATPAFQAADLLAYEHLLVNRKIQNAGGPGVLGFWETRRSLQALNTTPHGKKGEHWGVYDRKELELHCILNKYSKR